MSKSTHFSGQPMYGQLIALLDKRKVLEFGKEARSERYVKSFDAWHALCRDQAAGLPAGDISVHVPGSQQIVPHRHNIIAKAQHIVRCQCQEVGTGIREDLH